jgi:hypothetical protein
MDFRQIILDELKGQGKTRYSLAQELHGKVAVNTIYLYLKGSQDIGSNKLAMIFEHLGIEVQVP